MKVITILFVFVLSVIVVDMAVNSLSVREATNRLNKTLFIKSIFTYQDSNIVEVNVTAPDSSIIIPDALPQEYKDSLIGDSITMPVKIIEVIESTTITDK